MVELAVTMALGGLVLGSLGTVVLSMSRGVHTLTTTTSTAADVRIALEEVSRMLRVAYRPPGEPSAVVSATSGGVSFYALVDRTAGVSPPPPVLISYTYDPNRHCLLESRTAGRALSAVSPSGSLYAWDATPTVGCVLRTWQAPSFTYYSTGAVTSSSADPTPIAVPTGGLSQMDRQSVESVTVDVSAASSANGDVAPVSARTRVTLQNVVAEAGG
jgi:hypothetical protein